MSLLWSQLGQRSALREAEELLDQAEKSLGPTPSLSQRTVSEARLRALIPALTGVPEAAPLLARARALQALIDRCDEREFAPLRQKLEAGALPPEEFGRVLSNVPPYSWDPFLVRLLGLHQAPAREESRGQEMVDYVATSVHSVLELLSELGPDDVLYDLGSGLGLVVLLAAWLSPARARGVELEPAYVRFAEERARRFNFDRASFLCGDILTADYSDATALYLYFPVRGELLGRLCDVIEGEAKKRPLRIYSTGHSSGVLAARGELVLRGTTPSGMACFVSPQPT